MLEAKGIRCGTAENKLVGLKLEMEGHSLIFFRQILNRALNCWPEAPAEWKQLSDMLEHGKILQDYEDPKYASIRREGK